MTSTPTQSTFDPSFTAIYQADISEAVGQVVGPNTMGELFRLDRVEDLGDGRWRGHFELASQPDLEAVGGVVAGRDPRAGGR